MHARWVLLMAFASCCGVIACAPMEEEVELYKPPRRDAGVSHVDAGPANDGGGAPDGGTADAGSPWPPYVLDGGFARFDMEGWSISLEQPLVESQRALGTKVVTLLRSDLKTVTAALPPLVVERLKQVPIWILVSTADFPGGAYHPSSAWLTQHGYPAEWAKSITLGNAKNYTDWTRIQPAMVLHELAHAWHDQVLGFNDPDVLQAYANALDGGAYESVAYAGGGKQRAYGLNNHHEYFAEISEAWFWRNDFEPFTKSELQTMDPQGAALMSLKWQAP